MDSDVPATLRHIAEQAGLSVTTVSKILRGQYKGNTPKGRQRVATVSELAQRSGYLANASARRLRSGRHRSVAVLMPTDVHGHPGSTSFEYTVGITEVLKTVGYSLSLHTYYWGRPESIPVSLADRAFDGVIVLEHVPPELDAFLDAARLPAVYVNTEAKPQRTVLQRDEYAAARSVVEVVVGLGYRSFFVIGNRETQHFSHALRSRGVEDAVAAAGATCTFNDRANWRSDFRESVERSELAANTVVLGLDASTLIAGMRFFGPQQPLACCDDSHRFADGMSWLTRARFDRALLGRRAAELLLKRLSGDEVPIDVPPVRPEVVVGDSTPAITTRHPS